MPCSLRPALALHDDWFVCVVQDEIADDGIDQPLIVGHGDLHRRVMRASLEDDVWLVHQRPIDVHRHLVDVAEGRHCAHIAIGEQLREFVLAGTAGLFGLEERAYLGEIDLRRGRQH